MFFKLISIDNFEIIQNDLIKYAQNTFKENKRDAAPIKLDNLKSISPELIDWLEQNDLQLDVARFMMTPANSTIAIHVDGQLPEFPKFLALNLPLINCTDSHMVWWDNVEVVESKQFNEYGGKIRLFDSPNKKIISKLELTDPYMVRVDVPHSVDNTDNNNPRVILSLRFSPEPLHLWN